MSNCKHKFGEIKEGYQYCEICNKAEPVECNHLYALKESFPNMVNGCLEVTYVSRCIHCGDIKTTIS